MSRFPPPALLSSSMGGGWTSELCWRWSQGCTKAIQIQIWVGLQVQLPLSLAGFPFRILSSHNTLYVGLPFKTTQKFQLVQNKAARLLVEVPYRTHSCFKTVALVTTSQFKVLTSVFKNLDNFCYKNLNDWFNPCRPLWVLRLAEGSTTLRCLEMTALGPATENSQAMKFPPYRSVWHISCTAFARCTSRP